VRQWAERRRKGEPQATSSPTILAVTGQAPSARPIAHMLMIDDMLPEVELMFVSRLLAYLRDLANCVAAAKRPNTLLREKSKETLDKVLKDPGATALKEFVTSLRRDLGTVQVGLDLPWTTSPAECQINRLNMPKWTMYGSAGFSICALASCTPISATTARSSREIAVLLSSDTPHMATPDRATVRAHHTAALSRGRTRFGIGRTYTIEVLAECYKVPLRGTVGPGQTPKIYGARALPASSSAPSRLIEQGFCRPKHLVCHRHKQPKQEVPTACAQTSHA
jgi:hypothetical protein